MGRSQTVAPTDEPVSLEELKAHLKIDHSDEDADLRIKLAAARQWVEDQTDRQLMPATWRETFRSWPEPGIDDSDEPIRLSVAPVASVTAVTYLDANGVEQTLSSSVYVVMTDRTPAEIWLRAGQSWPSLYSQDDAVRVTYTAGYATPSSVPPMLRSIILMMAALLYVRRETLVTGTIVNDLKFVTQALGTWRVPGVR